MSQATVEKQLGEWSEYSSDITPEAREAFDEAFNKSYVGVSYSPVAFAKQIVSGNNYSFFCNAKIIYPGAPYQAAIVDIYKPLNEGAKITNIKSVNH